MSWVFLVFVSCGPDSVGRYSELIEMVSVLYLYSILRRPLFLHVWRVGQWQIVSSANMQIFYAIPSGRLLM